MEHLGFAAHSYVKASHTSEDVDEDKLIIRVDTCYTDRGMFSGTIVETTVLGLHVGEYHNNWALECFEPHEDETPMNDLLGALKSLEEKL